MKIYICASERFLEDGGTKLNKLIMNIHILGHEAVVPYDNVKLPSVEMSDQEMAAYFMGVTIITVLGCDAVYLCKGWEDAELCVVEKAVAEVRNLKVYTRLDEIPEE